MSLNSIGTQIPIEVAKGGTNSAAALSNGVMIVSSAGAIIEGTPTVSGGAIGAVTTFSMNSTFTNSSLDTTGGILRTDGSGVFSSSVTLPDGTLGTTQGAIDNDTNLATTAYMDRAVGWHGYTNRIIITPRDFLADNDYTADIGWAFSDEDGGVQIVGDASELHAFVPIPQGYKAVSYRLFGNTAAQDSPMSIRRFNVLTGTWVTKASGDTLATGEVNCTDFDGGDGEYVALVYAGVLSTDDLIYGGYIDIELI